MIIRQAYAHRRRRSQEVVPRFAFQGQTPDEMVFLAPSPPALRGRRAGDEQLVAEQYSMAPTTLDRLIRSKARLDSLAPKHGLLANWMEAMAGAIDSGELSPQRDHRENEGKTNFGDPCAPASADPFNELV